MQAVQTSKLKTDVLRYQPELNSELLEKNRYDYNKKIIVDDNELRAHRDIVAALSRLKLTRNEIKIYLFLSRHGAQRVQKISEAIKIQRTEAYKILRNLERKGIIFKILERPLRFNAVPFKRLLDTDIEERRQWIHTLEKKRKELIELWNTLPKNDESDEDREVIQVLEGKRQVSARVTELLRATVKKCSIVVDDRHLVWLYNSTFFEDIDDISKQRDLDVKMLTNYSPTSMFVIEQLDVPTCDIAFLHTLDQPSFIISDAGTMLILSDNSELTFTAMETNYSSLLKSYKNLFNLLWKGQLKK